MSEITPAKAIRLECKHCMGIEGKRISVNCMSQVCKLLDRTIKSPLRRIRAHCLDCVENYAEVTKCTGKYLYENDLCHLHQFRFGHNPARKGKQTAAQRESFKKVRQGMHPPDARIDFGADLTV